MSSIALVFILVIVPSYCQRPSFAGNRPIGYPVIESGFEDDLGFETLPAQLNGNSEYAKQLDSLPVENQPFFYVNKEHVAAYLKNPQVYPQRPSGYNENFRGLQ
ncbi:unnamed protein product [Arctia plantaginis]|uniref:Uncharacterized protein n=1 Tax=Arctia plantaginis TaxID=874455 RepID=A0A8S1B5N7_ARCPL|nr:unnamed protein product [Arctia plantaginis]